MVPRLSNCFSGGFFLNGLYFSFVHVLNLFQMSYGRLNWLYISFYHTLKLPTVYKSLMLYMRLEITVNVYTVSNSMLTA